MTKRFPDAQARSATLCERTALRRNTSPPLCAPEKDSPCNRSADGLCVKLRRKYEKSATILRVFRTSLISASATFGGSMSVQIGCRLEQTAYHHAGCHAATGRHVYKSSRANSRHSVTCVTSKLRLATLPYKIRKRWIPRLGRSSRKVTTHHR